MKSTDVLTVYGDYALDRRKMILHPNDGFDLGFMTFDNKVKFCGAIDREAFEKGSANPMEGTLLLQNDCRMGTVIINLKYWEEMGKPKKIKLVADSDRILVEPAS